MKKELKGYVLGLAFSRNKKDILLIQKTRPEWQKGLYNGVGGKVENFDKSSRHAMVREFQEKTGILTRNSDWEELATLVSHNDIMGGTAIVYCYKLQSNVIYQAKQQEQEEEKPEIIKLENIYSIPCTPNLPLLVGMTFSEFSGSYLETKNFTL